MSNFSVLAPANTLVLSIEEADGTTGSIDLGPYAANLMAVGEERPLTSDEAASMTATLGELEADERVHFSKDGQALDTLAGLELLNVGLYRALQDALRRYEAEEAGDTLAH